MLFIVDGNSVGKWKVGYNAIALPVRSEYVEIVLLQTLKCSIAIWFISNLLVALNSLYNYRFMVRAIRFGCKCVSCCVRECVVGAGGYRNISYTFLSQLRNFTNITAAAECFGFATDYDFTKLCKLIFSYLTKTEAECK